MKNSFIILGFFLLGIFLGRFVWDKFIFIQSDFLLYTLFLLLFSVGIGVGGDEKFREILRMLNFRIVLVPVAIIIGTVAGSLAVSFLIKNVSLKETLAIGCGFGYYSLSSVLIGKIRGETAGVIALLCNIMRELITLLFTPLFVKYFGKLSSVAAAGATASDTTLPVILKYSGKEYAMLAIFSAVVLTITVPVMVEFILQ